MPDEAMLEEMRRKLEETEALSEDDRALLADMLGKFRHACTTIEAKSDLSPEEVARQCGELRARWQDVLESSIKLDQAEGELLMKRADQADANRALTMMILRSAHSFRRALEEGNFTGTWEQREALMETVTETEEAKPSMLEELTVEDIRQLKDEGVL